MICYHCPERKFGSEAELEEHTAEHARIQQILRRPSGRTYGPRLAQDRSGISSQEPILPVANPSGTASSSAISYESVELSTATSRAVDDTRNRLARFMNKDAEYLIFRRFSSLNIYNILRLQTELTELEKQLAAEIENGLASSLQDLIEARLLAYNEAVTRYSQLSKLGHPEPVPLSDLRRWASRSASSGTIELSFLEKTGPGGDDLMSLSGRASEKTWLYRLTERFSWRLLSMPAFGGRTVTVSQNGKLHIYDDDKVRLILRAVLTAISSVLLLVPIGVLSSVEEKSTVVTIVALCCAAMALVMAVATECRDHEIIMAVAAYAAVLIVFADK